VAKKPTDNVFDINARPPKSKESKLYGEAEMRRVARSDLEKIKDSVNRTIESKIPKDVLRYLLDVSDWDELKRKLGLPP